MPRDIQGSGFRLKYWVALKVCRLSYHKRLLVMGNRGCKGLYSVAIMENQTEEKEMKWNPSHMGMYRV